MNKVIFLIFATIVLSGCYKSQFDFQSQLNSLYEEAAKVYFQYRPVDATALGIEKGKVGKNTNDQMGAYMPWIENEFRERLKQIKNSIKQIKSKIQPDYNQDMMVDILDNYDGFDGFSVGHISFRHGQEPYVMTQVGGPHIIESDVLVNSHPFKTKQDAVDYLQRLRLFDRLAVGLNRKIIADANIDWVPPKVIIERTIQNLESFIKPKTKQHPFYKTFSKKVDALEIESIEKIRLKKIVHELIETRVYSSYRAMIKTQQKILPKGKESDGIWAQPRGIEYYELMIELLADTNKTADEIHQYGKIEVNRVTNVMDRILKDNNFINGSVSERMNQLGRMDEFLYKDSDTGRQLLINDINRFINEAQKTMSSEFLRMPKFEMVVSPLPFEKELLIPAGMHTFAAINNSFPSTYWINTSDINSTPKFDLKTRTVHEILSGHHIVAALLEQNDLPLLRKVTPNNAFFKGWA